MAPQFVKPYVKTNKSDAADAEGICEAVSRPSMRFVGIKSVNQQMLLALHRARQGFVKARTAQVNQIRGLLSEFGIVMSQGIRCVFRELPPILEQIEQTLPTSFCLLLRRLKKNLDYLDQQVDELESEIKQSHRQSEACRRIAEIPGIGPITASAIVASIGDAREFKSGRQLAAWLGLVPRQHSSGGKAMLLGISKRGDCYLRTLLIHGARAVIRATQNKLHASQSWLLRLIERRSKNVASVALANKNARIIWALLVNDHRIYESGYSLIAGQ
jgi:transposase